MKMRLLLIFFICCHNIFAQIERYHNDEDTAKYIPPQDTITISPMYGASDYDFIHYLELNYNQTIYGQHLLETGSSISISFIVEKSGELNDIEVVNTSSQMMAIEILNILEKMPKWNPGKLDGKTKRIQMIYNLAVFKDNSIEGIRIEKTGIEKEYLNKSKGLKIFLLVGALLIMTKLLLFN